MTKENPSKQPSNMPDSRHNTLNSNPIKTRANQYLDTKHKDTKHKEKEPAVESDESKPRVVPRSELEWNDLISNRIEEAMRNGAFDNLRNKGKPLPDARNPYVPADRQMANDLLKNNGLAPQWITDRTSMLQAIELFRLRLQATALSYLDEWTAATSPAARNDLRDQWAIQLERWQDELHTLNQRINAINLQQPIARLEIFKLRLDDELKRINMSRTL